MLELTAMFEKVVPDPVRRERKNATSKEIALIANNGGKGVVLDYDGPFISYLIEDTGVSLDDLGLDDAPDGISIWEGDSWSSRDYWTGEYDSGLTGSFRDPTLREWDLIAGIGTAWELESCPACLDAGRIRCDDCECSICMRDRYCVRSLACGCGQEGRVTLQTGHEVYVLSGVEILESMKLTTKLTLNGK